MAIDLVTRREWGARAPRGSYGRLSSTKGVKVHYTGGQVSPGIVDNHDKCVTLVKSIQNQHMDGNGWIDVGYSLLVCPHRKVFEGRGAKHLPAANGEGLNSGHYAVLGMVGSSGLTKPNDAMLHGIVDAIEYLRAEGGAGKEVKGHQDGYSTSCPGEPLYKWVRAGAHRPKASTPPKPPEKPIKVVWDGDVPRWPGRVLAHDENEPMLHGEDVEVWQTKMERRGWTIDVDGWFGEQSAGVAKGYRRGTGLPAGDSVDRDTWDMTWFWRPPV